ncbi:ATP-dependent nuclease subunit B-like protein [Beutenbergia cavernae DSM 12333]|uniref:ATP-dependent nuclease subunit B-like protein n=1 Tax=Beutenbergia cavernae (strain ATCC BAA-8 / DSM 12333 / CCUG 43141 / JCM 11478 / NBRC 16432 / NCIMB 13614 / HKI 0122) TaxID=471853 RepID=C5C3C7_BEUC1|nr:ATP-dependent nuclease subunit B-like protein [Beutenbergia cavernae DSM 12333]
MTTAASGRPALDALRDAVREAKAGDPLAAVTVVVPDNLTGVVARRALAAGLDGDDARRTPGVAGLVLTTLPRLAETLVAAHLHPRVPATRTVVAAHWRAILREEPGRFGRVAEHPATVRALVRAHTELRDAGDEGLDAIAASGLLAADLVRLHRTVAARLATRWYDETDLLRAAAARLRGTHGDLPATGGNAVVVHVPGRLAHAERELLAALADARPLHAVVALTGVRRADEEVVRGLAEAGVEVPQERADDGARLGPAPPVATYVRHASDADDEVRLVARELVATLETVPAHRAAVLYAGASPYARLLHERLETVGIRVNGPGVRGVAERAITRSFLALLRLPQARFARADVFRALADAPVRTSDGSPVPVARWEQVSRLAAVVEGTDWDARLRDWAARQHRVAETERAADDPRPAVLEAADRDVETAEAMRREIGALIADVTRGTELRTWRELAAWALDLLAARYGESDDLRRLPPEEQYAAAALTSALRGLEVLDDVDPVADLSTAVEAIELELERAVPRVGRFGEGVYVGPLGEVAGLDADVVFVVGLAEDAYPGRLRADALLGADARAATDRLAPARTWIDDRHRALLGAFAAAPRVVATFPRGDLRRSTERLPTRWLLPTLRALASDRDLAVTDWDTIRSPHLTGSPSFATELTTTPLPADEQEWRVRAASAGALVPDAVVDAARDLLAGRRGPGLSRYDGDLSASAGLPDHATGTPVVSPTSLESFAECPHAWFVQRLLRVQPLELPEETVTISPLEIGTLVHACLDRLVRTSEALPANGAPWSAADRARLAEIFDTKAREAARRGATGHARLWEVEREALLRDLGRMLDDDDAWRASRGATVLASELTFGTDGAEPVRVAVPGGAVALRGSADKVDRAGDGTLIVTDVKTGSTRRYEEIEDDPVAHGTRLQLPVYAHAARAAFGAGSAGRAEALYWFVRKNAGRRIAVTLDADLEARFATTLGTLTASISRGWFPAIAPDKPDFAWVQCPYCNPDGLGHSETRERWERQRRDPRLAPLVALVDPAALAEPGEGSP